MNINKMKKLTLTFSILFLATIIFSGVNFVHSKINNPPVFKMRWLAGYHGGFNTAVTSQAMTANNFIYVEFENPSPAIVDSICYTSGSTASGNVTLAIYGPIITEESMVGAPLLVKTASTAQSGTNTLQCISVSETQIPIGRYYVGIHSDNSTGTYMRQSNTQQGDAGWGGNTLITYAALPETATTTTDTANALPGMNIRLK